MKLLYVHILILLCSCAGPYHPFGSKLSPVQLHQDLFSKKEEIGNTTSAIDSKIVFSPKYQVLHKSRNFTLEIKRDVFPSDEKVYFFYEGRDISSLIESISTKIVLKKKIIYRINNLTLPPVESHNFSVVYKGSGDALPVGKTYPFPNCDINESPLLSAAKIRASVSVKKALKSMSEKTHLNSALMAGLIAQESSFNPNAVSWAKAVGLTQITPLAEKQLLENKEYNSYPSWGRLPASVLRDYIDSGEINKNNDWKLNPSESIQGGFDYLEYISNYWKKPQNIEALPAVIKGNSEEITSVILASYNSGPSRVKRNLLNSGIMWLDSKELNEAKKYVYKVKSYCRQYAIDKD